MKKHLTLAAFAIFLSSSVAVGSVQAASLPVAPVFKVSVAYGAKNANILAVQQFLHDHGFLTGDFNGYYGAVTAAAVLQFQNSVGISPTDSQHIGPKTLAAMNKAGSGAAGTPPATRPVGSLPLVATLAARNVTAHSAILSGTVDGIVSGTPALTPAFAYGTSLAYGSKTQSAISGHSSTATVSGLSCSTVYHYRFSVTNAIGSSNGGDMTFTTASCGM